MRDENRRNADIAYDYLIEMISKNELKPGDRLPTIPLANALGISRTPVLEALKRMQGEGIVVFKSSNGAWLINPTIKEINDVYIVRAALEKLALDISFELITRPTTIKLKSFMELEREYCQAGNKNKTIRAGLDFHRFLARCCPNSYLVSCIENSIATTYAYLLLFKDKGDETTSFSYKAHDNLLTLIESGEKEKALTLIQNNLLEAFTHTFS